MIRFVLAALLIVSSATAQAQTLPKSSGNPLEEMCTAFLEQGGAGVSGNHGTLCSCLVREIQARLTRAELEAYNKASESGGEVPPAIMQKVLAVASTCLTQAQ